MTTVDYVQMIRISLVFLRDGVLLVPLSGVPRRATRCSSRQQRQTPIGPIEILVLLKLDVAAEA